MDANETELRSWKAIAAYLGVSVRAAQIWEKERGLPVRRFAGDKGRVLANRAELEEWRKARLSEPRTPTLAPAPRRRRAVLAAAVLAVIVAAGYLLGRGSSSPAGFRFENDALIVHDAGGRELWRKTFADGIEAEAYAGRARNRVARIGDIDGDGRAELLFVHIPPKPVYERAGTSLYCFSATGQVRWRFAPGKKIVAGGREFPQAYDIRQVVVFSQGKGPGTKIAVFSHQVPWWPSQVALLNESGALEAEYWHSGFLDDAIAADLDGDGSVELVAAGTDNGQLRATLVVLDPRHMNGASYSPQPAYQLPGTSGVEKAVLLFPRSCVNMALKPYNEGIALRSTGQSLVVTTWEGVGEYQADRLTYTLDHRLNVLRVDPDVTLEIHHRRLERERVLNHPFDEREVDALARGCTRVR